jgi:D-sedoheptulose 7-phosphate isomerase
MPDYIVDGLWDAVPIIERLLAGDERTVVEAARSANVHTIVLTGNTGRLTEMADVAISVPNVNTQYIQEAHLAIEHIVCELVECHLFGKDG